jgi:glutamate/tyrosine decarboxylase-like PLP-dependent enzyme
VSTSFYVDTSFTTGDQQESAWFIDRLPLFEAFSQGAAYYADTGEQTEMGGPEILQFRDLGPQTTRAFRALKVRVCLQAYGVDGYRKTISDDIRMAVSLFRQAENTPEIEAVSCNLSITTFRFIPISLRATKDKHCDYINNLNKDILHRIQAQRRFYPSHTSVNGKFVIRVCIVNFNTEMSDLEGLLDSVVKCGRQLREGRVMTAIGNGQLTA